MAEFEVTAKPDPIDFAATGTAEILQNVRMIISTPAFSCPLDRDFAWDPDVDAPTNVLQARQATRLSAAIRKYEPRAQFLSVTYQEAGENGVLKPVVRVGIEEVPT